MSYVVIPSFTVEHNKLEAFLEAARADATRSVKDEPGCYQFDVVLDRAAQPARVVFYEVYADEAAFEHHLTTPHLKAFQACLHLCQQGAVERYERVTP